MSNVKKNKCPVCDHTFFAEPLLTYENMPRAAQFLPDASTILNDRGISLEVFQCSGCGLVQLNNTPVPYFREVIRAAAISEEMKTFRERQFTDFTQRFSLSGKRLLK